MSEYFSRVTDSLNVLPLQASLLRQPELFGRRGARSCGPHLSMTDIWVRFRRFEDLTERSAFVTEHDSVWYPEAEAIPEIKPILFDLMRLVEGERLGGVLITKLPPGGRIAPHVDTGWHAGYYEKFFVPVQNEPGATFEWEDGVIAPRLGEVYWFRNDVSHWVENRSQADRISLIVCIRTPFRGGAR